MATGETVRERLDRLERARADLIAHRTALYRLYDAAGTLLYVGISKEPERRWKEHRKESLWWPEVFRQDLTWFTDRRTADQAEAHAIVTEEPRYNAVWNTPERRACYRTSWLGSLLWEEEWEIRTRKRRTLRSRQGREDLAEVQRRRAVLTSHAPGSEMAWDGHQLIPAPDDFDDRFAMRRQPGITMYRPYPEWCGARPWPAAFITLETRRQRGECPQCRVPVPCTALRDLGAHYTDHPYYCL